MTAQEFIAGIESNPPGRLYLFCPGKQPRAKEYTFEPVLARRAVEMLVQRYVEPSIKDLCYSSHFADETDAGEIVSIAQTVPFLAERRVLVVQNAEYYESESNGKRLHTYLEKSCDETMLILVANRIDRRLRMFKLCEKVGAIVECSQLREDEIIRWAYSEIGSRDKRIDPDAVKALVDRAGKQLSDVNNAVAVVCNYVGDREMVRVADVLAACTDVAEEEVWTLTDAIAGSRTDTAVQSLHALLQLGKSEFEILGSINWLLKTAYAVSIDTGEGKVNAYVARKIKPLADKLGRVKLRDAFRLCVKTDFMLRSTGVDRTLALELLVIKLAAPLPKRQSSRR